MFKKILCVLSLSLRKTERVSERDKGNFLLKLVFGLKDSLYGTEPMTFDCASGWVCLSVYVVIVFVCLFVFIYAEVVNF